MSWSAEPLCGAQLQSLKVYIPLSFYNPNNYDTKRKRKLLSNTEAEIDCYTWCKRLDADGEVESESTAIDVEKKLTRAPISVRKAIMTSL